MADTGPNTTETSECGAQSSHGETCAMPAGHPGWHAASWGTEADYWRWESQMRKPVHGAERCPECEEGYVIDDGPMEWDTGHRPFRCSDRCGWSS